MKIFILTKKKILIINFIILIIIFLSAFIFFQTRGVSAISSEQHAFQNRIWGLTKREEKVAYLTFDDGPNKIVTPKILDILKEENVKATFFVIGRNVDEYPEIVKREYEEGHFIANHTYTHNANKIYKNEKSFIDEIEKTNIAIQNAIGNSNYCPYLFRFPTGYMSSSNKSQKKKAAETLLKMNYAYIDWNCLNNDSMKKYTNYQLLENLKKSSKNKNTLIILMHDTKDVSNSSEVLKDSIKYLKSEGYIFKNFYDLRNE